MFSKITIQKLFDIIGNEFKIACQAMCEEEVTTSMVYIRLNEENMVEFETVETCVIHNKTILSFFTDNPNVKVVHVFTLVEAENKEVVE